MAVPKRKQQYQKETKGDLIIRFQRECIEDKK